MDIEWYYIFTLFSLKRKVARKCKFRGIKIKSKVAGNVISRIVKIIFVENNVNTT